MIDWSPTTLTARDGSTLAAELGELLVPEDRSGGSAQIRLRFARIKAANPTGAPPVIFLSGGPGDSGIQWANHPPFLKVFQEVTQHVDLILLDQRACGTSERHLKVPVPQNVSPDVLLDENHYRTFLLNHLQHAARVHEGQGAPLHAYTVVESAHDVNDLRIALGVDKVTIWGYSYGTHLSQMIARLHGEHVERIVLCGFEGPDQTYKFPAQIQAQIERLHAQAQSAGYDVAGSMARVHEAFSRKPLTVEITLDKNQPPTELRVGAFALQQMAAGWIGISNRFLQLPKMYAEIESGNHASFIKSLSLYAKNWSRSLVFYLKDAASGATPERLAQINAEAGQCILGNAANYPFPEVGPMIKAADIGAANRTPLVSNLPFLIFTGSLDGFTPTENAIEGMKTLPNAHHVVIENAAHNELLNSPEGVTAIAAFVARGELPVFTGVSIDPPKFD